MKNWVFVMVFFIGNASQFVCGDYEVSVKLLEYNRDPDDCCDGVWFTCSECDVYFQICLQPLLPTQIQICCGNEVKQRVDDTHNFSFANTLRDADSYTWKSIKGQPSFQISVHAYDYDSVADNDDLGVTSYVYRGNTATELTVMTTPGNKNLRKKLQLTISCSANYFGIQCDQERKTTMPSTTVSKTTKTTTARTTISTQSTASTDCL